MWTAYIYGPSGTPYEGYKFQLRIDVGDEVRDKKFMDCVLHSLIGYVQYPLDPPQIRCVTKCFHPNIHFEVSYHSI